MRSISKQTVLYCLLMLCLFYDYGLTLSPPYNLHWTINGASVRLTWKHSHGDEPLDGYYVSVQTQNSKKKLQAPDFVHVPEGVHSTDLQGLWPDATYKVKVVAFTNADHSESSAITIKTSGLELLKARNLNVSDIDTTKALFRWEHDAKHTIHDTQFKLLCRGVRQYLDNSNKLIEEGDDFEYSVYASSQGTEKYFANTLESNTKYTCHITTIAETVESPPTPNVIFNTAYGIPLPPPQPKVTVNNNSSFTVNLYYALERFGPISHYKVFAVPVRKEIDPITSGHHFVPVVPSSKLLTQSVQPQSISKDSDPAPLLVGTYDLKLLPRTIVFNGQDMRISFVPNTHYSFVTAVFTQSMTEGLEGLHSFSALANPPVFISKDLQEDWIQLHRPVAAHFAIIVTCTLVSTILLFMAAFLSFFAANYYQGKKRDAFFFTVRDGGDSSEDEIYSKATKSFRPSRPPSPTGSEAAPLLTLSPASHTHVPGCDVPGVSNSPAHVPTTSIHNSPTTQEPRTISQTPVTMQNVRDYLATKETGSAVQPTSHSDSSMPELHVYAPPPPDKPTSSSATTSLTTPQTAPARRLSLSPTELNKYRRVSVRKRSCLPTDFGSGQLQEVPSDEEEDSSYCLS